MPFFSVLNKALIMYPFITRWHINLFVASVKLFIFLFRQIGIATFHKTLNPTFSPLFFFFSNYPSITSCTLLYCFFSYIACLQYTTLKTSLTIRYTALLTILTAYYYQLTIQYASLVTYNALTVRYFTLPIYTHHLKYVTSYYFFDLFTIR